MFAKLLKYNFKDTKRIGIPILICLLGITVLGCVDLGVMISYNKGGTDGSVLSAIFNMLLMLGMMLVVLSLIFAVLVMLLFICVNFYKNLVSDEGYLTFTLPVKADDILLSKVVNGIIWLAIVVISVVISACALIMSASYFSGGNAFLMFDEIGRFFGILFEEYKACYVIVTIIMAILAIVVYAISNLLLYYMAIFMGSVVARKNKVLAAIGLVYGFNIVYGIVQNIAFFVFAASVFNSAVPALSYVNIFLAIIIVCSILFSVLFWCLTKYMMEKKLNLA